MKANRCYHPWWDWECYKAGFYNTAPPDNITEDQAKTMYRDFLAKPLFFSFAMEKVFKHWHKSCEHFLTNPSINRIAWLGQAAMCIETGVPSAFKGGFNMLKDFQQQEANLVAKTYLERWTNEYCTKNR